MGCFRTFRSGGGLWRREVSLVGESGLGTALPSPVRGAYAVGWLIGLDGRSWAKLFLPVLEVGVLAECEAAETVDQQMC